MLRDDPPEPLRVPSSPADGGCRVQRIADILRVPVETFFLDTAHLLYRSSNGDRWSLTRSATGQVIVLHVANDASGGCTSEIDVTAFLERDRGSPQHEAMTQLIEDLLAAHLLDLNAARARNTHER